MKKKKKKKKEDHRENHVISLLLADYQTRKTHIFMS